MSNRRIEMYEYRAIIYRLREGLTAREISKLGLAGRHKVNLIRKIAQQQGWLNKEIKLPDDPNLAKHFEAKSSPQQISKAEPHRDFIKQAVADGATAKVIHTRLAEQFGYDGAYNSVQRFVQQIKQSDLSHLTAPLSFNIAEAAQVDFGKGPRLYDIRCSKEVDTWFFVMTLCWSRHQYAELITHQDIETWLHCHQKAFIWFGGVVNKVIIDNAKCAITRACYYDPQVQRSYESFAEDYGFIISACPPREPKKKGRVESGVKYLKKNFLALREFCSLQQATNF